jgi:hypothetical protein
MLELDSCQPERERLCTQLAQAQKETRVYTDRSERASKDLADMRSRLEQSEKTAAER